MSELMRNIQLGGETFPLAVSQYGDSSPKSTTPGKPGVLYLNTFNGNLYKCTAADPASDSYTWVAMVGAGGVFATTVRGQGAEEISAMTLRISKPNTGYVLSVGDKLITADNYLYEVTALPEGLNGEYRAKLIRNLSLTDDQIAALDALFQLASYGSDSSQALADFRSAFGIGG